MKRPDLRSMKQNPELMRQASEAANPETMAILQNTFMQYQGKSETELIDELMRKASIQRQKGMLNNAQLATPSNLRPTSLPYWIHRICRSRYEL